MKSRKITKNKLSYESDGKMGEQNEKKKKRNDQPEFFNFTQNSE
ncbi:MULTISPECIES: hypothetical protein [Neobacillus]|jgi:hypothetical protein|nr:hypothetical protein [Neobacillus sedimentimangrovi]